MESEEISLENSCRLCLKIIKGEVLSVSIFETVTNCHSSIPVKIKTCVSIDVQAEDLLPRCICKDCHNKLDDFFTFKQVCLAADLQLKTLLARTTIHNSTITNDKCTFDGSYDDTTQDSKPCQDSTIQSTPSQITVSPLDMDMFSLSTIKTEPYYSEEECGMAVAMELDALSDDAEIDASNIEPSTTTGHLPIQILETFSLTCDNQRINRTAVKVEPPDGNYSDTTATMQKPNQDVFRPIKMEIITEQEPLNENIPLAHYISRKIIGVHNRNFIYNINDEGTSENKEHGPSIQGDKLRKNHRCNDCGESFRRPSDLQAHCDTHLPTKLRPYVCCVCPETFGNRQWLERHERAVHSTGPHRCKECLASRRTLRELRQHISRQHPHNLSPTELACAVCGLAFEHQKELDRHLATAHRTVDRSTFTCNVCDIALEHQKALDRHLATAHRIVDRPTFTCNVCGIALEHQKALDRHLATAHHIVDRPTFTCNVCGIALEHQKALDRHLTTAHRTVDKPTFKCDMCGLALEHEAALIFHQATAHPPTPLPTTFNNTKSRKLPKPADEASRARPGDSHAFSCQPCGLDFHHKGALICHQAFYHRIEMNRNVARATVFTCEVCHMIFTRKDHYVIHKESHKYVGPRRENGLAVKQLHHFLNLSQNYTI